MKDQRDMSQSGTPDDAVRPVRRPLFSAARYHGFMMYSLCALPLLGYLMPRALSFLPGLIGLLGFIGAWYVYKQRPALHRPALLAVTGVLLLAGASALWSAESVDVLERTLKIALVLLPGILLVSVLQNDGQNYRTGFIRFFPVVTLAGFALAFWDLQSYGSLFSLLRGEGIDDGFNESNLNRGIIVLTLCLFPAVLCVWRRPDIWSQKQRNVFLSVLGLLVLGVFLRTDSQSAHLIFAVCLLALFLFPVKKSWAWAGLWLVLTALVVTAPWLAQSMFNTLPDMIGGKEWFEQSYALNRLEIWDFVSRYVEHNPLWGLGLEATRSVHDFDVVLKYHDTTEILHPHNFALQVWMEFGVLGPAAVAALFAYIFLGLRHRPAPDARLGLIVFLSALCPAAVAYGLWQGWLLGLFMMMAGYCFLLFTQQASGNGAR